MASAPLNWLLKIGGDALTTVAQTISGAINELKTSLSGKADKVSNATTGNFAGLDANGNIVDSGVSSGSFTTTLSGLTDTSISSPQANQGILYNSSTNKWENKYVITSAANANYKIGSSSGGLVLGSDNYVHAYMRAVGGPYQLLKQITSNYNISTLGLTVPRRKIVYLVSTTNSSGYEALEYLVDHINYYLQGQAYSDSNWVVRFFDTAYFGAAKDISLYEIDVSTDKFGMNPIKVEIVTPSSGVRCVQVTFPPGDGGYVNVTVTVRPVTADKDIPEM